MVFSLEDIEPIVKVVKIMNPKGGQVASGPFVLVVMLTFSPGVLSCFIIGIVYLVPLDLLCTCHGQTKLLMENSEILIFNIS